MSVARSSGIRIACLTAAWLTSTMLPAVPCAAPAYGAVHDQAASAAQQAADSVAAPTAGAPVVMGRDTIFRIEARLGPFSAEDRARAISERISAVVADHGATGDSLAIVDAEGATDIVIGDDVVFTVTDADAVAAGVPRIELARTRAEIVQRALRERSARVGLKQFGVAVLLTLLASAAAYLLLRLVRRIFPKILLRIDAWRGTAIRSIRIQKLELISADRIADFLLGLARVVRFGLVLLILYFYVPLVLSFFPQTQELSTRLFDYVLDPIGTVVARIGAYLPNLLYIAVIVLVTRYLLKLIRLIFTEIGRGNLTVTGFFPEWAEPTYKIVRFMVLAFAAVITWPYLPGSGSDAFQGISVFLGILLSIGSASAVANVVAGVVMTYMRPFHVGDRVGIADTVGDVIERTLLVTRLRTAKNVDVTIPNAMVLGSHIINYSSTAESEGVVLHTTVTIGYDVPWREVREALIAAARATEDILADPPPFVLQTALNDFSVSYELNAYTNHPNRMTRIYSTLHENIQDTFNEAGIEIMSPHFTAVRDGNPTTIPEEYLPKGYRAPALRVFQVGGAAAIEGSGGSGAGRGGGADDMPGGSADTVKAPGDTAAAPDQTVRAPGEVAPAGATGEGQPAKTGRGRSTEGDGTTTAESGRRRQRSAGGRSRRSGRTTGSSTRPAIPADASGAAEPPDPDDAGKSTDPAG